MKIGALTASQRLAAGLALVGALGGYAYFAYALTPLVRQLSSLAQEIDTTRRQLQFVEQMIVQGPHLKREQGQLQEDVTRLRQTLPPVEAMPSVIERLSDLARQTDVKIQSIQPERTDAAAEAGAPGQPATAPERYRGVPIQIDALAGFFQLQNFVARLESNDQPMRVQSLRISEHPKELRRHNINVVIIGYFATVPPTS